MPVQPQQPVGELWGCPCPMAGLLWQAALGCRAAQVLMQYCILANHYWFLVEAVYLYKLLIGAVFSEKNYYRLYLYLGWGRGHPGVQWGRGLSLVLASAAAQTSPGRVRDGGPADPGCPHSVPRPGAGFSAQAGSWFYRVCCVTCRDAGGVRGALGGCQVPERERGVSGEGWRVPLGCSALGQGSGRRLVGVPDPLRRGWHTRSLILPDLARRDGADLRVSLGRCWALNENMAYWWIIRIPILLASLVGRHPPAPHLFREQQLSPWLPVLGRGQ